MEKPLFSKASTTKQIRREIQNSKESLVCLAKRFNINPKTAAKWRKRDSVEDAPRGPSQPHSTVLTIEEEAVIKAFRIQTLLPLSDCFCALKTMIPKLTRSSLHRCFQRHGINRLPNVTGGKKAQKKIAQNLSQYPTQNQIGSFQLDIVEVDTEQKQLYLYIAIDHQTKFTYTEFHPDRAKDKTIQFLHRLNASVPHQIQSIVTDDGIDWINQLKNKPSINRLFKRLNK